MNDATLIYKHWNRCFSSSSTQQQSDFINQVQDKTFQQYTLYKPIWHKLFFKIEHFTTINRILSFKYWSHQKLINLFDDAEYYFGTRSLNQLEKQLFNAVTLIQSNDNELKVHLQTNQITFKLTPVINADQFKNNFEHVYFFSEWSRFINWNYFIISGSSVLANVINKNWTDEPHHDIDIYSHSISVIDFRQFINKIYLLLRQFGYLVTYDERGTLITFVLRINNFKRIRLQFIFTCKTITALTLNKIIENFDIDICQILYNVKENKILCTGAFIQSLQTEYIIPYRLIIHKSINQTKHISRIRKYFKKGFENILLPKSLPIASFEKLINYHDIKMDHVEAQETYCPKVIPCDFFEVQKKLLEILHQ